MIWRSDFAMRQALDNTRKPRLSCPAKIKFWGYQCEAHLEAAARGVVRTLALIHRVGG